MAENSKGGESQSDKTPPTKMIPPILQVSGDGTIHDQANNMQGLSNNMTLKELKGLK